MWLCMGMDIVLVVLRHVGHCMIIVKNILHWPHNGVRALVIGRFYVYFFVATGLASAFNRIYMAKLRVWGNSHI